MSGNDTYQTPLASRYASKYFPHLVEHAILPLVGRSSSGLTLFSLDRLGDEDDLLGSHSFYHMETTMALARRVPEGIGIGYLRGGVDPNEGQP